MRFKKLYLLLALVLFCAGCGGSSGSTGGNTGTTPTTTSGAVTLKVFAAASLTESFNEIAQAYQKEHGSVKVTFNFNGSQLLAQQLISGAQADVFASADKTNMTKVSDAGLMETSSVFAKNKLTVIVPSSNPGKITTLKDLSKKGVKIVVAAPAVPVGKYSLQVLDLMGKSSEYGASYVSAVKSNFVSQEENVKAVVEKVQLGEADAGFVYQTDVTSKVSGKVTLIPIPDDLNVIAQYPIAVTKNSAHKSEAQAFVEYITGSQGQTILGKYRFVSAS